MKQNKASAFFILIALIFASSHPALADAQWHYQASAQVSQPGLIETVLPAGVFFGTDSTAKTTYLGLTLNTRSQLCQTSLAVTIQMTKNTLLYGNHDGCRLSTTRTNVGDVMS